MKLLKDNRSARETLIKCRRSSSVGFQPTLLPRNPVGWEPTLRINKRFRGSRRDFLLLGVLCVLPVPLPAQEKKPALLAACIEPVAMRTETAEALPGSKHTVVCPAREDALGLSRLSAEEFKATGLSREQFLKEAAATAAAHLKSLKPHLHRDAKGRAEFAILKSDSHLTASVILCPEFHAHFKEAFGDKLVVLVPDRFTVYVFARGFGRFQDLGPEILEKHSASTWPCSREAFVITAEGLKCLGSFETGDGE